MTTQSIQFFSCNHLDTVKFVYEFTSPSRFVLYQAFLKTSRLLTCSIFFYFLSSLEQNYLCVNACVCLTLVSPRLDPLWIERWFHLPGHHNVLTLEFSAKSERTLTDTNKGERTWSPAHSHQDTHTHTHSLSHSLRSSTYLVGLPFRSIQQLFFSLFVFYSSFRLPSSSSWDG